MPNRQLLLLRHAKAAIGEGLADIDRSLAGRGERASKAIGRYMAENGLAPDLVICSPALRTRRTWEIVSSELPRAETRMIDSLYDFGDGEALLAAIQAEGGAAERLLLVGHNPAIQNLALSLAGSGDKGLKRVMAEKYPTGGLAIYTMATVSWAEAAEGRGRLEAFIRPRDLED